MQTLPPPVDQLIGQTLGNYHIEQLLGRGNLNAVFLARHHRQNNTVMLTVFIIPNAFSAPQRERFLARFSQEANTLVRLEHPHILPIYDSGVQLGYPYLVTPLQAKSSLASVLQQQSCCTPAQTLEFLKPIAAALDYAHSQGVFHGSLKSVNILFDSQHKIQIAGFGLTRILEMRGIEQIRHPQAHLLSVANTFLGAPEYIAPEVVRGQPIDARSDVYSLGIILFELLSGKLPFTGNDPFAVAMQHVQQSVPLIQTVKPDVPVALNLVLQRALEHDPAQRTQSAGKLANAFERVINLILESRSVAPLNTRAESNDATLPPTVNWFNDDAAARMWQQAAASPSSDVLPVVKGNTSRPLVGDTGNWQLRPPITTGPVPTPNAQISYQQQSPMAQPSMAQPAMPQAANSQNREDAGDPFLSWSTGSLGNVNGQVPGTFRNTPPMAMASSSSSQKAPNKRRRRTVALLAATGGVVVVAGLGFGAFEFLSAKNMLPFQAATMMKQPTDKKTTQTKQGTTGTTPKTPTKTQNQQQNHTGVVVGMADMPNNTSKTFTNPVDGAASLLIRLPDGNFVAYESACTHQQVTVYYDADAKQIVCPRHLSHFDPANAAAVLDGPAPAPLPMVAVRVNTDGTVTAG